VAAVHRHGAVRRGGRASRHGCIAARCGAVSDSRRCPVVPPRADVQGLRLRHDERRQRAAAGRPRAHERKQSRDRAPLLVLLPAAVSFFSAAADCSRVVTRAAFFVCREALPARRQFLAHSCGSCADRARTLAAHDSGAGGALVSRSAFAPSADVCAVFVRVPASGIRPCFAEGRAAPHGVPDSTPQSACHESRWYAIPQVRAHARPPRRARRASRTGIETVDARCALAVWRAMNARALQPRRLS
jgi:hypothetical protein